MGAEQIVGIKRGIGRDCVRNMNPWKETIQLPNEAP
jgi:hypothetical protein